MSDLQFGQSQLPASSEPTWEIAHLLDPREGRVIVFRLKDGSYEVHGEFSRGAQATSHLLPGFAVDVDRALAGV